MSQPLYQQVADQIREHIQNNIWTDKIPTENDLCNQFGVSRITVRRAVQDLCDEGLIEKRHGLGMFVGKNDYKLLGSVLKDRLFDKKHIEHKLLQVSRDKNPSIFIKEMLKLNSEDKMIYMERLAFHKGEPVDFEKIWIPERLDNGNLFENISNYELVIPALEHAGISISKTRLMLEPRVVDEDLSILKLDKGSPVLLLWRIAFDQNENPVALIEHLLTNKGSQSLLHFDFQNS
ncbi:GntR family transcriptional regulator [Robertmurraya kyonggiensis]|uniref:GntR family transcriptional regulator n=1 Tax=Robertmurraya kyonggiensis TaxID=1037680 RepID=A0A4U1D284_9BACI|nr:GntR family transcriptional regulator [Robertmurraya kyonggiensis]TKC16351.1 GntR family transcriptional regulator [Robertmurraya kyonggiensis]